MSVFRRQDEKKALQAAFFPLLTQTLIRVSKIYHGAIRMKTFGTRWKKNSNVVSQI